MRPHVQARGASDCGESTRTRPIRDRPIRDPIRDPIRSETVRSEIDPRSGPIRDRSEISAVREHTHDSESTRTIA